MKIAYRTKVTHKLSPSLYIESCPVRHAKIFKHGIYPVYVRIHDRIFF